MEVVKSAAFDKRTYYRAIPDGIKGSGQPRSAHPPGTNNGWSANHLVF
ncbi:hypothetical protein [Paenibacillus chitinolyticus]|uniref:Uncharacterized protein n=1 Tax=Paenibacillus chitinolyticus TaxID=79263 RepID=A0ABT4FIW6_9BACL|nr:hypothetical protein [Paenibacillus chitinolyticus]MCY9589572.1 hypothetical protein [Paenibacillus chitinolyticus]MCY9598427.1 hypothetical protein [Paenibacillus chitinolyticus]